VASHHEARRSPVGRFTDRNRFGGRRPTPVHRIRTRQGRRAGRQEQHALRLRGRLENGKEDDRLRRSGTAHPGRVTGRKVGKRRHPRNRRDRHGRRRRRRHHRRHHRHHHCSAGGGERGRAETGRGKVFRRQEKVSFHVRGAVRAAATRTASALRTTTAIPTGGRRLPEAASLLPTVRPVPEAGRDGGTPVEAVVFAARRLRRVGDGRRPSDDAVPDRRRESVRPRLAGGTRRDGDVRPPDGRSHVVRRSPDNGDQTHSADDAALLQG